MEIHETDYREQQIKKEVFTPKTSQMDNQPNSELMNKKQTERFIRVKKNLFESRSTDDENGGENFLRTFVQENAEAGNSTDSLSFKNKEQEQSPTSHGIQENIVCSPELMQYIDSEKEPLLTEINSSPNVSQERDDGRRTKPNSYSNQALYELISQKFSESMCDDDKEGDNFKSHDALADAEQKSSIGGLFLRNPRGLKVSLDKSYFLNSIFRKPNKTLRCKRLIFSIGRCKEGNKHLQVKSITL